MVYYFLLYFLILTLLYPVVPKSVTNKIASGWGLNFFILSVKIFTLTQIS